MQAFIAILSTTGSFLGILGAFINKPLFFIGGMFGFFGLLLYGESIIRSKEQIKREAIATKLPDLMERGKALKDIRRLMIGSRIITAIVLTAIFLVFRLSGISWIGILFGLLFLPELIGKLIKKAANAS